MKNLFAILTCCFVLFGCVSAERLQLMSKTSIENKKFFMHSQGLAKYEYLDGDSKTFTIKAQKGSFGTTQANVPRDALVYGYMNFGELTGSEPFFDRLVNAAVKGLSSAGHIHSSYINKDNNYVSMEIFFKSGKTHVVMGYTKDKLWPYINSIDLGEYVNTGHDTSGGLSGALLGNAELQTANNSPEERLEKIKSLFDKGLISQEDYDRKKEAILSEM